MPVVTPLAEQWDAIISEQPGDWSQLRLELRLDDTSRTERACVVLAPLNPWRRDDDYRIGILRFMAAARFGYGAFPGLVRTRLGLLDVEGLGGTLALLAASTPSCPSPRKATSRRREAPAGHPWLPFCVSGATRSISAAAASSGVPARPATPTASRLR